MYKQMGNVAFEKNGSAFSPDIPEGIVALAERFCFLVNWQ